MGRRESTARILRLAFTVLRPPRTSIERMSAHHCCSGRKCYAELGAGETTVTPIPRFHRQGGQPVILGDVAHIVAREPSCPRGDPFMPRPIGTGPCGAPATWSSGSARFARTPAPGVASMNIDWIGSGIGAHGVPKGMEEP
jgi:hypothetical protein